MLFRQWKKKYNNSTNECIVLVSYFIQKNSFEFIARSQSGPVLPILDSRGWNKENKLEQRRQRKRTEDKVYKCFSCMYQTRKKKFILGPTTLLYY